MNAGQLLVTITLAATFIVLGCAGNPPANEPQDTSAAPVLLHASSERPQATPAVAMPSVPESSDSDRPGSRIVDGRTGHDPGTTSWSRDNSGTSAANADIETPQPVPSSAGSASRPSAVTRTSVQDALTAPATEPSANDVPGPSSPTANAHLSTPEPRERKRGENAASSIDTGWGPAPTKSGKLGVVKPATRPIDIDPTLVDAIKLPDGDPRRQVIGVWEQVSGSSDPDFAHGDYSKSILTFRNDGVLDVARFYGPRDEVRVNRQLVFRIENSNLVIATTQGADATSTDLALAAGPNGTTIPARKPKAALPTRIGYTAKPDSIVIDGRTYKRIHPGVPANPP